MHAGFPQFTSNLVRVMQTGAGADDTLRPFLSKTGGKLLANSMALLIELGFTFIMRDSLLGVQQAKHASRFFEDNFVFIDPLNAEGKRYYQGKFLIRTRRPGDDMNVYFCFCPQPDQLFIQMPWGKCLDPKQVVTTEVLTESEADQLQNNPDKVDLVIQFKDVDAITGLIGRPDADIVGLLLESLVQLKGNVGHLFKLGAIGTNVQLELDAALQLKH